MKIKMPSIKALKITLFFTFFIWIFITLYAFLTYGIKLERFSILGAQVSGFYLRLDKKLILNIESLNLNNIKSSDDSLSISTQRRIAKNTHYILQYFQSINIKNIDFKGYSAKINYDGEHFTIDLPRFYAKLALKEMENKEQLEIIHFYFKPYNIYFSGSGFYNLRRQRISLDGKLSHINLNDYSKNLEITLSLRTDFKTLDIRGHSESFSDIKFLEKLLPEFENPLLKAWIFDNYSLESAKITDMGARIPLSGDDILQKSIESLFVFINAKNADVIFNPQLPAAYAESLEILFQNNTLSFHPTNPTFQNHSANGTSVAIKNLISFDNSTPELELNLHANTALDSAILSVLKAYDIDLPLNAPRAKISTALNLSVNLDSYQTKANGIFKTKNSTINLNGIPLKSSEVSVNLNNNLIKVETKNTSYENLINLDSSFIIDTNKQELSGDFLVNSLELVNSNILKINNLNLPFLIDFKDKNNIALNLPTLKFNANLGNKNSFILSDLSTILNYSKILRDYKIKGGILNLKTSDFINYTAEASLKSEQNILLNKDNTPLESAEILLNYTPSGFILESKDSSFIFSDFLDSQRLSLNNLNINLSLEELPENELNSSSTPFLIEGKNATIFYEGYTILSDSFNISLVEDSIKGQLKHKNGVADFYKRKDSITLDAKEFGDEFLNTLSKQELFKKGRFFLNLNTDEKGVYKGKVKILSTSINKLGILQNIIAFIDTIPSLLTFKSPGFNQNGYFVESGEIDFGLNKEFLAVDKIDLNGSSMDLKGKGIMHLESKNLDFQAQLIFAKGLSGIVNKIPLVNYILLGKDGTISTNLKIKGTLDKPNIQTQTAQDVLLSPFNILKRTITAPFEIFN